MMALTTVEDVVAALRWSAAEQAQYEAMLPGYIDAASLIIEGSWGPFEARTIQHVADGGSSVTLPYRVNTVTAVHVASGADGYEWVDGYLVPADGWATFTGQYTVNLGAGIVYGSFPAGRQNVRVTFTSGFDEIPADVVFACNALVVHMWAVASQRGPGLPEDYTAVPTGFLVPNVVKEALSSYQTMPGFA